MEPFPPQPKKVSSPLHEYKLNRRLFVRKLLLPSLVVFEGILFALVLVELHVQLEAVVPLQRVLGNAHVHLHRDLLQRSSDHAAKEAALVDEKKEISSVGFFSFAFIIIWSRFDSVQRHFS